LRSSEDLGETAEQDEAAHIDNKVRLILLRHHREFQTAIDAMAAFRPSRFWNPLLDEIAV